MRYLTNNSALGIMTFGLYKDKIKNNVASHDAYFKEKMANIYNKFEPKRQHALILAGIQFWGIIALIGMSYFFFFYNTIYFLISNIFILILLLIKPASNYGKLVISEIFPIILKSLGKLDFKLEPHYSIRQFENFHIIPNFDNENNKNYICGTFNGLQFEIFVSELSKILEQQRQIIFNGLVIKIKVSKKFNGVTIIKKDIGLLNFLQVRSGLQRIALEDPEFESKFEVFANDQIESRYLLTTSFMERLLRMQSEFKCENLTASFADGHLLILLDGIKINLPKICLNQPAEYSNLYLELRRRSLNMFEKIAILKLDKKIGL